MAARRACIWPSGAIWMPLLPQPCWRDSSRTSQSVSEPGVVTPMRLPLRSLTDLIGELASTSSARLAGGPYMAATATAGTPLARKPMPGPDPKPISTLPAVSACWSCASPRKAETSSSSPSCSNSLASIPTSTPAKAKELGTALPTLTLSSACAAAADRMRAASAKKLRRNTSRIETFSRPPTAITTVAGADLSGGPGTHQRRRSKRPCRAQPQQSPTRFKTDQKWRMARAGSDERRHLLQAHGAGEPARLALLILAQAHDERPGGQVEPLCLVGAEYNRRLAPARLLSRDLADDVAQLGLDRSPILLLVGREIERSLDLGDLRQAERSVEARHDDRLPGGGGRRRGSRNHRGGPIGRFGRRPQRGGHQRVGLGDRLGRTHDCDHRIGAQQR